MGGTRPDKGKDQDTRNNPSNPGTDRDRQNQTQNQPRPEREQQRPGERRI